MEYQTHDLQGMAGAFALGVGGFNLETSRADAQAAEERAAR